jgi:hypothetical protein
MMIVAELKPIRRGVSNCLMLYYFKFEPFVYWIRLGFPDILFLTKTLPSSQTQIIIFNHVTHTQKKLYFSHQSQLFFDDSTYAAEVREQYSTIIL